MNGYWTCLAPNQEQSILGDLVTSNALSFFARLSELGIPFQMVTEFMPEATREDFYAGKCVLMVRKPGVVEIINIEIYKKGLTKPPDKA